MTCPAILTFDYDLFVSQIPQYSNPLIYPEVTIENFWNMAICYVSDVGNFGCLQGACRQYAINLMTAHLIFINSLIISGQTPSIVDDATVDKVHVGLVPPNVPNQFDWWLNTSPYGQQLLALLEVSSVGGFSIGGSPVLASFGYPYGYYNYGGGSCGC